MKKIQFIQKKARAYPKIYKRRNAFHSPTFAENYSTIPFPPHVITMRCVSCSTCSCNHLQFQLNNNNKNIPNIYFIAKYLIHFCSVNGDNLNLNNVSKIKDLYYLRSYQCNIDK